MSEEKKLVNLIKIDGNFVPKWVESTPIEEEQPKYTYIGKFHVGASVEIGDEKQRINRITRRKFKNKVIHEVLECQDVVVVFAYDWEKVQPYAADVEKLRRFFSPSTAYQYRRSMYETGLEDEREDMLITWRSIRKFPNGDRINILPILFVKNGILEDFVNMEEFSLVMKETPIERIGGAGEQFATDDSVVQS